VITIEGRNVNELWSRGLETLRQVGVEQDSRAGRVLVAPCPVVSVYQNPTERVLIDPHRDANPFFHLMESLWMLAGRDDAAFLNRYVGDFGKRFAENGDYIHGAYGKRWREALGFDQLDEVVSKLRRNPDDRQAVIQMWDASDNVGMQDGCDDLMGDWKDRPCNTHVYLRVRKEEPTRIFGSSGGPLELDAEIKNLVLDLTVLCRSNDIVWGAYGANAVHFSVLQEYLAGRIGIGVGRLYQFSNNWHGYADVLKKFPEQGPGSPWCNPYQLGQVEAMPIGTYWSEWDADLVRFMAWHDSKLWRGPGDRETYANSWFAEVAERVAAANLLWKEGARPAAMTVAEAIPASDWREACVQWMQRRMK
jgi:thymidylate synthase